MYELTGLLLVQQTVSSTCISPEGNLMMDFCVVNPIEGNLIVPDVWFRKTAIKVLANVEAVHVCSVFSLLGTMANLWHCLLPRMQSMK